MEDQLAEIITQEAIDAQCLESQDILEQTIYRSDGGIDDCSIEIGRLLAEKYGLTAEQEEELHLRLSWKFFLLPK